MINHALHLQVTFRVRKGLMHTLRLLLILALLLILLPARPALAGALAVTTLTDELTANANCSLREAIAEANAAVPGTYTECGAATGGGADTISVPAGTYTLTLGSELLISTDMTISGAGAGSTIIEANVAPYTASYRVLQKSSGTVTLSGLTIRHGVCTGSCAAIGGHGGGILHTSGTLTLNATRVSLNRANSGGGITNGGTLIVQNGSVIGGSGAGNSTNTGGVGGGIFNASGGTTTIDASTVSANIANTGLGGGVATYSTLTIQNGSVIGGSGTGNSAASGGGIYDNNTANTTVTGSSILGNTGSVQGGAVYHFAGTISVTGSCIVGNSATAVTDASGSAQTFTGNWWGATDGPGSIASGSGDTISTNITTTGFLSTSILGCPYLGTDLTISKSNTVGGAALTNATWTWTLVASNNGLVNAAFGNADVVLVDDLPVGPTYGTPNVTYNSVTGTMTCTYTAPAINCTADAGGMTINVGGSVTVSISAVSAVAGTFTNSPGSCTVDSTNKISEGNETNNACNTDSVTVSNPLLPQPPAPGPAGPTATFTPTPTPTRSSGGGVLIATRTPTLTATLMQVLTETPTGTTTGTATSAAVTATATSAATITPIGPLTTPTPDGGTQTAEEDDPLFDPEFIDGQSEPVQDFLRDYEDFNNGLGKPFGASGRFAAFTSWTCCCGILLLLLILLALGIVRGRRGEMALIVRRSEDGDDEEEDDQADKSLASKDEN